MLRKKAKKHRDKNRFKVQRWVLYLPQSRSSRPGGRSRHTERDRPSTVAGDPEVARSRSNG